MALKDQSVIGMLIGDKITPLYPTHSEAGTSTPENQHREFLSTAYGTDLCYDHYVSREDVNCLISDSDGLIEIPVPNISGIQRGDSFYLFGEEIVFLEPECRFLVLKRYTEATLPVASMLFEKWYEQCRSMDAVLNDYPTFVVQYLHKLVLYPLYSQLGECGIFELSFSHYAEKCSNYSECESALLELQNQLQEIQGQAHQVQETVRGANSSLLGTAAGTIAGNITNNTQKRKAYSNKSVCAKLLEAFKNSIETAIQSHINILNNYIPDYLVWNFDESKATGLFESAIRFPQKREELLLQSFKSYPRNPMLLKYVFETYPNERKEIIRVANN